MRAPDLLFFALLLAPVAHSGEMIRSLDCAGVQPMQADQDARDVVFLERALLGRNGRELALTLVRMDPDTRKPVKVTRRVPVMRNEWQRVFLTQRQGVVEASNGARAESGDHFSIRLFSLGYDAPLRGKGGPVEMFWGARSFLGGVSCSVLK